MKLTRANSPQGCLATSLGILSMCTLLACAAQSASGNVDPLRCRAPLTAPIAPTPSLWHVHQTKFAPVQTALSGPSQHDAGATATPMAGSPPLAPSEDGPNTYK